MRRFTYANVAATLALVFSMSGGALAASHYLINSTRQINPKVLKKLTGKTGAAGKPGAPGATGKEGPQGKEGPAGAAATKLFAVVSANAEIVRGSGALSAVKVGTGKYIVKFNANITQCAFFANVGTTGFEGEEAGDTDVAGSGGTVDSVYIETRSNAGTLANKSFHLAVLC